MRIRNPNEIAIALVPKRSTHKFAHTTHQVLGDEKQNLQRRQLKSTAKKNTTEMGKSKYGRHACTMFANWDTEDASMKGTYRDGGAIESRATPTIRDDRAAKLRIVYRFAEDLHMHAKFTNRLHPQTINAIRGNSKNEDLHLR